MGPLQSVGRVAGRKHDEWRVKSLCLTAMVAAIGRSMHPKTKEHMKVLKRKKREAKEAECRLGPYLRDLCDSMHFWVRDAVGFNMLYKHRYGGRDFLTRTRFALSWPTRTWMTARSA